MTDRQYNALDAVTVLNDLARVVRAAPDAFSPDLNAMLARELEQIARATAREIGASESTITHACMTSRGEWAESLLLVFFPEAQRGANGERVTGAERV